MHSYIYNYAPIAFNDTWTFNNQQNLNYALRNNSDDLLLIPFPRIELFKKSPLYQLPTIWNSIAHNRYQTNRFTFKWALKCNIFENWAVDIRHLPQ